MLKHSIIGLFIGIVLLLWISFLCREVETPIETTNTSTSTPLTTSSSSTFYYYYTSSTEAPPCEPAPAIPTQLEGPSDACSGSTFEFSWSSGLEGENYTVEISTDTVNWEFQTYKLKGVCKDGTHTKSLTIPIYGEFFWRVKHSNSCGSSDWVNAGASFTVLNNPGIPDEFHSLPDQWCIHDPITLGWDNSIANDTYYVELSTDSTNWTANLVQTEGTCVDGYNESTVTLASLGTYYWRVKEDSSCGTSSWYEHPTPIEIIEHGCPNGWIGDAKDGWHDDQTPASNLDYQSFNQPSGMFLASNGDIYIADRSNHRITKWNSLGEAQGWIGGGSDSWKTSGTPVASNDPRAFNNPTDVFLDGSDTLYIADKDNHRICKWDSAGTFVGWIGDGSNGWKTTNGGSSGSSINHFYLPYGVCVDGSGTLFVADSENHRISKWSSTGDAQGWIGAGNTGWQSGDGASFGDGYNYLSRPVDVILHGTDLYIVERFNPRISKWNSAGEAQGWIGGGLTGWNTTSGPDAGSLLSYFYKPTSIFILADGTMYVTDSDNHRISVWDSSGQALHWIGGNNAGWEIDSGASSGSSKYQFDFPMGIGVDTSQTIFVCDSNNARVTKWVE